MGQTTTLFIIFLMISLALSLVNPTAWGSPFAETIYIVASTEHIETTGIYQKILAIAGLGTVVGITASYFGRGDISYGLFAGFVTFMLGFAIAPINLFFNMDIPIIVKVMIGVPLSIMFMLALFGWWKGSEL